MITREIEIDKDSTSMLRARIHVPQNTSNARFPLVVLLTGDGPKGTQSLSWTNIPPMLAKQGIASFLFDFQGLGYSPGQRRHLTLSRGLENFRRAISTARKQPEIDESKIGIFGSSFGGNIAILYAAEDSDIKCIGLKSPVSFYPESFVAEFSRQLVEEWETNGYIETIGFDYAFYTDSFRYNNYAAASTIKCPCLITHGDADSVVPLRQSQFLRDALVSAKERRLNIYHGVGHGYSEPGAWQRMAEEFVEWFQTHL